MKKACWLVLLMAFTVGMTFSEEGVKGKYDWAKKFFFDFNMLYNYENIKPEPKIVSNNLLFEIGAGYDFGRITARLYGDLGVLLGGDVFWINGSERISESLDSNIWKFGIEAGFKVINRERFSVLIPFGFLFNWTSYEQKNPSYTTDANHVPYDREWKYQYTSIVSGINASVRLSKHFSLLVPFSIGIPIVREYEYSEILRGNYYWTKTGTPTYTIKDSVDVFTFSLGLGVRANF
ncbi:MAG: hypothetical protein LBQ55_05130 [Treponema sp.]|jgi:hypothetical protein|nr:hypothetical protein [Treponema sp.]